MFKLPVLNVDDDEDADEDAPTDVTKVKGAAKAGDPSTPVTVVFRANKRPQPHAQPSLRPLRSKS